MRSSVPFRLALVAALLSAASLFAQQPAELPPVHVPVKPVNRRDLDHVEALKAYALGVVAEHDNRLIEAVKHYEEAARLDPDAAAPLRALAPLYVALDRSDDALDACRKALQLDPEDANTGYFYARQLRAAGKIPEAVAVFARTAGLPGLKDKPGLRLPILLDMGAVCETAGDLKKAEAAFRDAIAVLDKPDVLMEQEPISRAEIDGQAAEIDERLARLCLKDGRPDQAAADFE
ncbi:MAG TPA: hypothetical protein VMS17_10810, partial [Gemmataceae bacterium]|nr:hypothetical protein [Gemmataceae bacterium]